MRHILWIVLALEFIVWSGCATPAPAQPGTPMRTSDHARAMVEMLDIRYDGQTLSGRILVSALGGNLRLDRRLLSSASVNVDAVSECETGAPVAFLMVDSFPPAPSSEDLLILEPGYWYGTEVRFPLFSERLMGRPGPDCIEADVSLLSFGGNPIGHIRIRAARNPQSSPDAGTPGILDHQRTLVSRDRIFLPPVRY